MKRHQQSGAALLIALIMLLISTTIGLAAIRGATLSEKMTGNLYDRSLAYQAAESALRAGEAALESGAATPIDCVIVDPSTFNPATHGCPPTPRNTFEPNSNSGWNNVGSSYLVNTDLMAGSPQYYVEKMGEIGGTDEFGLADSANCANYAGCDETPPSAELYRITGRSTVRGDDGRSVVALQITVKQNL
ncbi:pilus assembly PilX family protein [Pseudomonas saliphila]|uniref:pilus assembly PilX family protein n=1 Tax=Pseudomonas saliphila TaxID=2586906 RepID=UPI00123B026F|nr:PilX N-terminal domain-containing pilus assembly protein [Pseudomonas saliphila]